MHASTSGPDILLHADAAAATSESQHQDFEHQERKQSEPPVETEAGSTISTGQPNEDSTPGVRRALSTPDEAAASSCTDESSSHTAGARLGVCHISRWVQCTDMDELRQAIVSVQGHLTGSIGQGGASGLQHQHSLGQEALRQVALRQEGSGALPGAWLPMPYEVRAAAVSLLRPSVPQTTPLAGKQLC